MVHFRPAAVALTLALVGTAALPALADSTWKIDPNHSSAEFAIKHFALSNVRGNMPIKTGTIVLPDGKDIPTHVDATLIVSGVDTKQTDRDSDLKSPNWFDAAKYPTIAFTSTKIEGTDPANFTIAGDLTIHGVTKPVVLQAHLEGKGQGGQGEKRVAYSAVTTIHRADFGISDAHTNAIGDLVVGKDATISLSIEGIAQ
jgi:polyisoprenoid-binding protein YceI